MAASAAARASSGADMVSIQAISAPPSLARGSVRQRRRPPRHRSARRAAPAISPVGPTEPATMTFRPALSATRAGDLGGPPVELVDAVLRVVQLQPVARAAEGIGEDDVGAGIDEILVQRRDLLRARSRSSSSGASPASSPMANRLVPVAPSASSTPFSASSASMGLVMARDFQAGNNRDKDIKKSLCLVNGFWRWTGAAEIRLGRAFAHGPPPHAR